MKYNKHLILLIVLISTIQGCAANLKIEKIPDINVKSPLSDVKPLTIVVGEFEDERPMKEEDKDAINLIVISKVTSEAKIVLNKNKRVADIVSEAISNELKRNGHNVINSVSDNTNADLIIKGCVGKCGMVGTPEGMWYFKFDTIIELKVVYITQNSNKILARTYNGSMTRTKYWCKPEDLKELTEAAFSKMIEEFATDPELFGILKELEKAKYKM